MIDRHNRIRPVTYGLALYFFLAVADVVTLGALGSLLKIIAVIPLVLSVLDIRRMRIRFDMLIVVQLLFLLLAVFSIFYSIMQSRTISSVSTLMLNLVLVMVLGSVQVYNEAEVKFLYRSMLLGSWLTVALILCFSGIASDGRLTLQLGEGSHDQNLLNGYTLFAFSHHCNAALLQRKWKHFPAALLLLGIVLLTGSRGALVAYAVVALMYLALLMRSSHNPLRNTLILLVVTVLAAVFWEILMAQMPPAVAERFSWDYIAQYGTTGRTKIWRYLLNHFCDDTTARMFFGHGYGTTAIVNQRNHLVAHNLYLDNLITLGIIGVTLQIITQACVLRELARQKATAVLGAYLGMIVLCLSLSLTAAKLIWNIVLLTLIMRYRLTEEKVV